MGIVHEEYEVATGRDTAKMLQFKINPALLFDAK